MIVRYEGYSVYNNDHQLYNHQSEGGTIMLYRYGFIYETTNLITGEKYIGRKVRTQDPNDPDDSWYLGSGTSLLEAIEIYGKENFTRRILEDADDFETLTRIESQYLMSVDAMHNPMYYNRCNSSVGWGASGPDNLTYGKIKISRDHDCRCIDPEDLEKYVSEGWYRGLPDYVSEKLSIANTGKKRSELTRHRMSISSIGVTHSVDTKKRISDSIKDLWSDAEYREKQSESHRGYVMPEETKLKLSKALSGESAPWYGKKFSEEHKKNLSESKKNPSLETRSRISEATRLAMSDPAVKEKIRESRKNFSITKNCEKCSKEYIAHSNRAKYCEDCRR